MDNTRGRLQVPRPLIGSVFDISSHEVYVFLMLRGSMLLHGDLGFTLRD